MTARALRKTILEFIELYKAEPCLWQFRSKDYHNRRKKEAAYKILIEKLREIEPDTDKKTVVKKINCLRSNVRKERRKYESSIKSGASGTEVYRPKLWYYNMFQFLFDPGNLEESNLNAETDGKNLSLVSDLFVKIPNFLLIHQ